MAKKKGPSDDSILTDVRDRHSYGEDEWREIRAEGAIDMRCIAGDMWDPAEKAERKKAGRPALSLDELGQYRNQLINSIRLNKRAVAVTPLGGGATDQTAQLRGNLIRQIEYRSKAQDAYTTMFQNTVDRSYGFLRIVPRYVKNPSTSGGTGSAFEQELVIEPMVNPDLVTPDPDALRPDGSDMRWAVIRERYTMTEFKRRWPSATVTDFSPDLAKIAPKWLDSQGIYVGEYWTIETTQKVLLLVRAAVGNVEVFEDDLEKKAYRHLASAPVLKHRDVTIPTVKQYLTNGLEILERTDWPGLSIPLVCCYGQVLYVDDGSGAKRKILSMVRLARDPAMLYCYYRTTEAELTGMTPKTPFIGYEGQFRGHEERWQKAPFEPVPYLEVKPTTAGTGTQVLPLPQRQPYDPPIQAMEMGAESARRAIQAAMGIAPLPTAAQRMNEKSGVALDRINDAEQQGSFHFVDHYDGALARVGVLLNELIPHYYDTAREVAVRDAMGKTALIRINDPSAPGANGQPPPATTLGDHDVTITTGPSFDSERAQASDFADKLVQNPQVFPLLAPLVIKLKNLGPVGDEMARILEAVQPPEVRALMSGPLPAPAQAQIQALTAQLNQLKQALALGQAKQQAQIAVAKLNNASREKIAGINAQAGLAEAEVKAGIEDQKRRIDILEAMIGVEKETRLEAQQQGHEARLQRAKQVHEMHGKLVDHAIGEEAAVAAQARMPPPVDGTGEPSAEGGPDPGAEPAPL